MTTKQAVLLLSVLLLAGHVSYVAAQTPEGHAGTGVSTVDLDLRAESETLANAKEAFRQGGIVRIVGGAPADLQRLLGVVGPRFSAHGNSYQVVAARVTKRGALHQFVQWGPAAASSPDLRAYANWVEKEKRLALQEETGVVSGDPSPPAQAWTELQQVTSRSTSSDGNVFQNTLSVYRLNDISPNADWYMVLTEPQSQPNYLTCTKFFGPCGWWTDQRVFTMSTVPAAILFDHGPNNPITTSNASFTIGGTLNQTGPGVTAGFTTSWSQPSVVTTDQSNLNQGTGQWNEAFAGFYINANPPETSIGLFSSHQGSIFQVPEGTTSFQFTLSAPVTSAYVAWNTTYDPGGDGVGLDVFPPVFAVSATDLAIPPGGSGAFGITAMIPSTGNNGVGIPWAVSTDHPEWLTVSQTSGSASTRLTLNVAPNTPKGSIAYVNVDTNPQFAAPSVEKNPLVVKVTVGEPDYTGTLLTGGWSSQSYLSSADLYSAAIHQFDFATEMTTARAWHTATLLLSGQLLVAGGGVPGNPASASAELFGPDTHTFTATAGMMTGSRSYHTATLLENGKVLLAGGQDNSQDSLSTAELYDPDSRTFKATGSMAEMRIYHSAALLLDGTVLVAAGSPSVPFPQASGTAEIYNPATAQFTTTGKLNSARYNHTATVLNDGQVLIAGGFGATGISAAAELYNPATKTFLPVGNLNVGRVNHAATLLPDGQVLITGGRAASAELYDPKTQTFTLLSGNASCPGNPHCMTAIRSSHTATLQPDGTVLVAFGLGDAIRVALASTELYDPKTQSFSAGPGSAPRQSHAATPLQRPTTTTTLTSSHNPSTVGQEITLTATVATLDGVATGSIAFLDGDKVLGNVRLQSADKGIKTLKVNSLGFGSHSLTARYSGGVAHRNSKSPILVQTVTTAATTTALRSSPNPSKGGELVTFTATVTAASGSPTGVVSFRDNGTELQKVNLEGNTAVYRTDSLSPGPHRITAAYSGDGSFASSMSPVLTQDVSKLASTIVLASKHNPSRHGRHVQVTATVKSTGAAPTGRVQFKDGDRTLGPPVPLQSGMAPVTLSNLSIGPHGITGEYSGDSTHAGVVSPVLHQTVNGRSRQQPARR